MAEEQHSLVRGAFERLAALVAQGRNEHESECERLGLSFQREDVDPRIHVVHLDQDTLGSIICDDWSSPGNIVLNRRNGERLMTVSPDDGRLRVQYPDRKEPSIMTYEAVAHEFLALFIPSLTQDEV